LVRHLLPALPRGLRPAAQRLSLKRGSPRYPSARHIPSGRPVHRGAGSSRCCAQTGPSCGSARSPEWCKTYATTGDGSLAVAREWRRADPARPRASRNLKTEEGATPCTSERIERWGSLHQHAISQIFCMPFSLTDAALGTAVSSSWGTLQHRLENNYQ